MNKLDLHGIKHDAAETKIIKFVTKNNPPFEIITGDSTKMRKILMHTISKFKLTATPKGLVNYGSFIITEHSSYCLVCGCDPCDCHWGNY
tara:strand:- start:226 stop:495 length:270 start_codon:yes stop_codon:yes gene_type:complete